MKFLTLEYIKAHSRIDYDCEDSLLSDVYGPAAEDTVLNILGRGVESLFCQYGQVPAPVMQAALMLVDLSYEHRSPVSAQQMYVIPYTIDALLRPYMIL